jgi:hypothetical protein
LACLLAGLVWAAGQATVSCVINVTGGLLLGSSTASVQIRIGGNEWPAVLRTANDLAFDFGRVTGVNGTVTLSGNPTFRNASMIFNATRTSGFSLAQPDNASAGGVIIAGTIGNSNIIDGMIGSGKLNVMAIKGQWESYVSQVLDNPIPGVDRALVIAGNDRRGTIYGLYDVSEQIGVSPWYFWADVPPRQCSAVTALPTTKTQASPSIKYRGFYINDNAPALTGWVAANYPDAKYGPGYGAEFHTKVFELILRLKANYLWPAGSDWDQAFFVDDNRNQPLADEYGVVLGTSHTEPFMRTTKEWSLFGKGAWSWPTNNASVIPFMRDGAVRAKPYESVITIGMRGSGDTALSSSIETSLLENIVDTQREILAEMYGRNNTVTSIPQLWCLYKEVQGFYEEGMRVPDDVILLWSDDNFGNIRRLPNAQDKNRKGGAGVYFHLDYDGLPRNYKWHNTIQLQRTWEQMHMAYERNAREMWIVNTGDIKPVEMPLTHFFDMAYDFDTWSGPDSATAWQRMWMAKTFGESYADNITEVMNRFGQLAGRRKFELVDPSTYSVINYNEADRVLQEWSDLAKQARVLNASLPETASAAFFELVLHPVLAGQAVHEVYISSARNLIYGIQGRNTANDYAQAVLDNFAVDHDLTVEYHSIVGGKWNHMMDQAHIGYVNWNQPKRQLSPPVRYVQTLERPYSGDLGVSTEGTNASVPGDDPYHTLFSNSINILPADPFGPRRYVDVFNIGTGAFDWNITGPPYVDFVDRDGTPIQNGTLAPGDPDLRLFLAINWAALPHGSSNTTIKVSSSTGYGHQQDPFNGYGPSLLLPLNNTAVPSGFHGFVESDATISMEAEHYSRVLNLTPNVKYTTIPWYGKTLSSVTLLPPTSPSLANAKNSSRLEYDFYSFTNTTSQKPANITVILGQGLNTDPTRPLKYAIAVDNQPRKIVQYVTDQSGGNLPVGWDVAVSNAGWTSVSNTTITAGSHTLKLWLLEPGVVVQKIVIDLGGVRPSYLGPPESKRI